MTYDEEVKKILLKMFQSTKARWKKNIIILPDKVLERTLSQLKALDNRPGMPLRRLNGIGDYCVEAGLCKGIEMRPPELFLIEDHKRLRRRKEASAKERSSMKLN